jgi:hypothetical protein
MKLLEAKKKIDRWLTDNIDVLFENSKKKNSKRSKLFYQNYALNMAEQAVDHSRTHSKADYYDSINKAKLK